MKCREEFKKNTELIAVNRYTKQNNITDIFDYEKINVKSSTADCIACVGKIESLVSLFVK